MCNIEVTTIWKIEHVVICPHCIVVHLFMHCNGYPSIQASSVITIPMVVKYTDGFSCCLLHPVAHYICTSVEFYPMYGYITFWRVHESLSLSITQSLTFVSTWQYLKMKPLCLVWFSPTCVIAGSTWIYHGVAAGSLQPSLWWPTLSASWERLPWFLPGESYSWSQTFN